MAINVKVDNKNTSLNGEHQAVLSHIYDIGLQENSFGGEKTHKVVFLWELNEKVPGKDYRWTLTKEYALSLGRKATLRKDLETVYGAEYFEDKDGASVDIEKLIGLNAILTVEEKKGKDNKDYPNIVGIAPAPKEFPKLKPELKRDYCPDWISKKMGNCYQTGFNPTGSDEPPLDDKPPF